MVFSEYINGLPSRSNPKRDVIRKIAEACLVNETSVYRWASGECRPDALKRQKISEVLRVPESELFPEFCDA